VFVHVNGEGNKHVKGLTMGQRVSYTEMTNDKGACAGNVKPIEGVCVGGWVRSCKKERG
jgi:cold shock CspA family protein